jgi:pimeloyl-ACP methyl ester carboxylesterase
MIHSLTLPGHGRIHAETSGRGEPILFLHADFVDGRMWNAVRDRLDDRFLTVAFDKLGYGRSDAATGPVPRRQELKTVVDALKLGPLHLVGCSNGGRQALDFALEHPALVKSLTLVNASPSGWEPQGAPPLPVLSMIEAFQKGDLAGASELQLQIWFDGPDRVPGGFSPERQAARAEASVMNRIFVDRGTLDLLHRRRRTLRAARAVRPGPARRSPGAGLGGRRPLRLVREPPGVENSGRRARRRRGRGRCRPRPPPGGPRGFRAIAGGLLDPGGRGADLEGMAKLDAPDLNYVCPHCGQPAVVGNHFCQTNPTLLKRPKRRAGRPNWVSWAGAGFVTILLWAWMGPRSLIVLLPLGLFALWARRNRRR